MPDNDSLPLEITCQDVAALRAGAGESLVLVDCREPEEVVICRIDGARLMPMASIPERHGELTLHQAERIVVYCHKGGRSYRVAAWLRQQGFALAQSMAGGIEQWANDIERGMAKY